MSFQVALTFEDGVTRFVTAREGQTVAEASYRARINIPVDCLDGACGTCKAFCESGDYDPGYYIEDALTQDEAAQGYCLPCQMRPKSDLVIRIASTSEVAKTVAGTFQATVVDIRKYSHNVMGFTIEVDDRDKLSYLPGQYVNIDVPGTHATRSYSFSTAPDEARLSFLVKITPGGAMSTWLAERAKVGDRLTMHGPNGSFFLREGTTPLLLLAGGTGLAPILAMLRKSAKAGSTRPMHLIYGVNTDDEAIERDTLDQLQAELPNFTWDYCVADPEAKAEKKGYVTAHMDPKDLYEGNVSVYVCGPPPMVEAVRQHFQEIGLAPQGFFDEKFSLASSSASRAHGVEALEREIDATELGEALVEEIEETLEIPAGVGATPAARSGALPEGAVGLVELAPTGQEAYGLLPGGRKDGLSPLGGGLAELTGDSTAFVVTGLHLAGVQDGAAEAATPNVALLDKAAGTEAFAIGGQSMKPTLTYEPLHETVQATVTAPAPTEEVGARRDREQAQTPAFFSPGRFAGKVVLVTGAAQGIGERVARRIAAEGGTLVLADRSDLLDEVTYSIEAHGGTASAVKADLETYAGAQSMVDRAIADYGRIDVAIHVVGGTIWRKPYEEYREDEIEKEIRRSLFPTLWSCRAVLPQMYRQGHGTIVNISSTATMGLNRLPYSAAKGGVNSLTKSLAFEAAPHGVRVVATAPGGTDAPPRRIPRGGEPQNEAEQEWHQVTVDQSIESSLLKRYGSLDEQAAAICFLASDEASYITGTVLPVAGGDLGG